MSVSLVRAVPRVHVSHRVTLLPIMGSLFGCTRCWRIVGYRCGRRTIVGRRPCVADPVVDDIISDVWRGGAGVLGEGARERVEQFRAALRTRSTVGGRHAAGD